MQKPFQDELHSEAETIQLKFLMTGLVKAVLASYFCHGLISNTEPWESKNKQKNTGFMVSSVYT